MQFRLKRFFEDEDRQLEYIIDETEYARAIRAQVNKSVFLSSKFGSITGSSIDSIAPAYDLEEMQYNPTGPDFLPKAIVHKYEDFMYEENKKIIEQYTDASLPDPASMRPRITGGAVRIGEVIAQR